MTQIKIGRLLRSGTDAFVVGCQVSQIDAPAFGGLVRIPLADGSQIYGLIHDIRVEDDDLVRQLVTTENVDDTIIADNRVNRNVPVEISAIVVGFQQGDTIRHMLPPRPALSLDMIYLCNDEELVRFTSAGRFGYFRHILRAEQIPTGELLAAHIGNVYQAGQDRDWVIRAARELINLLRSEHDTLMSVLGALSDAVPEIQPDLRVEE
ncbi:MAG: hypothetical protein JW862_10675 [Anaerolineales bacterium]|nr:hypothetical protein [Anaerolineales bacterium]